MLEIRNLTYSYSRRKRLIENLSLTIEPGTVCGLLGKNGSGKSTLIYLLCGLLRPQSGEINLNGYTPSDREVNFLNDIFLVPEEFDLPNISIEAYVRVNAPFYPRFDEENLKRYLELFELDMYEKLGHLSMGQRKKAFISFAMACNTRYLILDEPTNGLDITSKRNFRKAVAECMDDEKTIIISTHQVYDLDKILDHVVVIDREGILLNSPLNEISEKYSFSFTTDPSRASNALISLDVPGGFNIAELLSDENNETEVNLETLFELITQKETTENVNL